MTHLSDYGISDNSISKIVQRFADRKWALGEHRNITADVVKKILILRK
jgi:alcohol dehydrogenase YqhD (iron-dependent ADH family)